VKQRLLDAGVARRIVGLFILSALVPVLAMAGVSFTAVNRQLESHSRERLAQLTRNAGQSILQQLRTVEIVVRAERDRLASERDLRVSVAASPTIRTLAIARPDGTLLPLLGAPEPQGGLDRGELDRLADDRMVLRVTAGGDLPDLSAGLALDPADPSNGLLWAGLVSDSIWSSAETFATLPTVQDFCVIASGHHLHCTSGRYDLAAAVVALGRSVRAGTFRHEVDGVGHLVGHWSFYPSGNFAGQPWTVLVGEDEAAVYAPLNGFSTFFALGLALALLLVVLLSNVQIRRTLEPLRALTSTTTQIAAGDLDARVVPRGEDEFAMLGRSFNAMAATLSEQLRQLEAAHAVAGAALAGETRAEITRTALSRIQSLCSARSAGVLAAAGDGRPGTPANVHWLLGDASLASASFVLAPADIDWLCRHPDHGVVEGVGPPWAVAARRGLGAGPLVAFPHLSKGMVQGATILELPAAGDALSEDEARRVRRYASQVAIALNEVRLVSELEELSWGSLVAFARAIDAKSQWTAGHSERVTAMALGLARTMGVADDELDTLHRAALLHDIGKIGVSNHILEKPGPLTPEEEASMRQHPEIGARILAPISAFAPSLPIVAQHHESWDGSGYPRGLSGLAIHPLARVLAVADTFDAIVSARPYRVGRPPQAALEAIRLASGRQFEPRVVEALQSWLEAHETLEERRDARAGR
jgi:putative nucleotidyltransferase with HDIG domain